MAPWSAAGPEPELDVAIDFDEDEETPAPGPRGIGRGVRLLLIGTAAIMGSVGGFVGGILLSEAFR